MKINLRISFLLLLATLLGPGLLRAQNGKVLITCDARCLYYIDDNQVEIGEPGVTTTLTLKPGDYLLSAKSAEYPDVEQADFITVTKGGTLRKNFELKAAVDKKRGSSNEKRDANKVGSGGGNTGYSAKWYEEFDSKSSTKLSCNNMENLEVTYSSGNMVFNSNSNKKNTCVVGTGINVNKAWKAEMRCGWGSGINNNGYGMVFAATPDVQFIFQISSNGYYQVTKYDGQYTNLIEWTSHDAVKQGAYYNLLRVEYQNGKASFYLNDTFLKTVSMSPAGDRFGAVVQDAQKIYFDYIHIDSN